MATEKVTPDLYGGPHPCTECWHDWHGTPCDHCICDTSCRAPDVIIPLLRWTGDDN